MYPFRCREEAQSGPKRRIRAHMERFDAIRFDEISHIVRVQVP
jgi:hypothetical protein